MQKKGIIAIFGGSFNPPLNSHKYFAEEVLKKVNGVKKVIFVPVNSKYNKEGLISNEHRYNMLKLIVKGNEQLLVSSIELDSDRQLYTIETLEHMKLGYPNDEIYFITGSDNLKELGSWREAERLAKEFKIIIFKRNDDNVDEIIEADELLNKYKENFVKMDDNINKELSSSMIRNMIKENEDVRTFMSEEVFNYIKEEKLYV